MGRWYEHTGCAVEGCDRPHTALGLCRIHYVKQWRAGRRAPPCTEGKLHVWSILGKCTKCGALWRKRG